MIDKQTDRAVFSGPAHLPVAVEDRSDTWSHDLASFGLTGEICRCERVEILEEGPLRAAVQVRSRVGASTITSTYLLCDDPALPLEIRVSVDWHEHHQLLRLCYPFALPEPTFRYEVPYGSIERPADGREYPGQRWVLVSGTDGYHVSVANDAKYSYAAKDGALYLTALRSPVYAHHNPIALDPAREYAFTDQGEQSFIIRLQSGVGLPATVANRIADELMYPPVVTPHVARNGTKAYRAGLLDVEAVSSSVTWLKTAEGGADPVLRVVEHDGRSDTVVLPASGDLYTISPYGVVTLRRDGQGHWRQSDGMESVAPVQ